MDALPIDPHLPALVGALREHRGLVVVAEPGAGKTTRLPRALLDAGFAQDGEILVLEPRRIAARMAATRVAQELGEPVGKRIGYQVRFEERSSADTLVRFVTEGVLTRKLIADPALSGVAAVVLDEFHERNIQGDLGLALLRRLQRARRGELTLCVMSATLDAQPVSAFLDAPVIEVPGRRFEVAIEHAERRDERPLPARVAVALRRLVREGLTGDVLVFLPGAAEIRASREELAPIAEREGLELHVLHGDLPAREQDRAVARGQARKVILSTNLAESSLTIEGVAAVIDSGLARRAGHSPFSGLPTLETAAISQASATQRAGRAGRVRAGRCLRLYTRAEHDGWPLHDKAEIARVDLSETVLAIGAIDAGLGEEHWYEAPPTEALRSAKALLSLLGALDDAGAITERGRAMLKLPVHPRLSRLMLEARARGVARSGATLAALLSERDIRLSGRARFDGGGQDVELGPSDAIDRLDRFEQADGGGFDRRRAQRFGLDAGALSAVGRVRDRLTRALGEDEDTCVGAAAHEEALGMALLSAYGDRVARRRRPGSDQLVFARGGSASQSPASVVREAELVVVLDARERRGGRGSGVVAHLVSAIEPEWLLELFAEHIEDVEEVRFDAERARVEAITGLRFGELMIDEGRGGKPDPERAAAALAEAAVARGLASFADQDALERFVRRVAHAARASAIEPLAEDARERALRDACEGALSFADLTPERVLAALRAQLPGEQQALLERLAPEQVQLPGGRRLKVSYEADRPPWVESRLQDFFGMADGPRLGDVPLVLHLLAPNRRAVQVTTDLAGFWERHYPEQRRQLMRRYPRHDWPQDPRTAAPPKPRGRRR